LAVLRTSDMSVLTTPLHVHAFEQVDATPITSDHLLPIVDRRRGDFLGLAQTIDWDQW
jgi:hypothetical protein